MELDKIIQNRQPQAQWKNYASGIQVKFDDFLWTDEEVLRLESMGWYEHEGCWILFDADHT